MSRARGQLPMSLALAVEAMQRHEGLRQAETESLRGAETSRRGQDINQQVAEAQIAAQMERMQQEMAHQTERQNAEIAAKMQMQEKDFVDTDLLTAAGVEGLPSGERVPSPFAGALLQRLSRQEIAEIRNAAGGGMGGYMPSYQALRVGGTEEDPQYGILDKRTGGIARTEVPVDSSALQERRRKAATQEARERWKMVAQEHGGVIDFNKLTPEQAEQFAQEAQTTGTPPYPVKAPEGPGFWATLFGGAQAKRETQEIFKRLSPPTVPRGGAAPGAPQAAPQASQEAPPAGYVPKLGPKGERIWWNPQTGDWRRRD